MTAYATESGLTLICPVTQLAYQPAWARVEVIGGERYIQSKCRHCDAAGRVRQDPDFNPSAPQIHTHLLDQSKEQST